MINSFKLYFTSEARLALKALQKDNSKLKRLKAVKKTLAYLEINPRHPSLNTHKYSSLSGPNGEDAFEAYTENRTPAAYRIFWMYGPGKNELTILSIIKHP